MGSRLNTAIELITTEQQELLLLLFFVCLFVRLHCPPELVAKNCSGNKCAASVWQATRMT